MYAFVFCSSPAACIWAYDSASSNLEASRRALNLAITWSLMPLTLTSRSPAADAAIAILAIIFDRWETARLHRFSHSSLVTTRTTLGPLIRHTPEMKQLVQSMKSMKQILVHDWLASHMDLPYEFLGKPGTLQ